MLCFAFFAPFAVEKVRSLFDEPRRVLDIRTNHATKQYGAKTYYPANIMNILNEKRNNRTDYS